MILYFVAGEILACFEEDARSFLFPKPKLVTPLSGVDREVLMMKAFHFPVRPPLETHQSYFSKYNAFNEHTFLNITFVHDESRFPVYTVNNYCS